MRSGPSKAAEAVIAFFTPLACREEVLGDLCERYRSPLRYALEAACTVPAVIVSRIRRTADPQVLLIQAFALYGSYLGASWFSSRTLLGEPWGLLRLAIPAGMAMLGLILEDAYASPPHRSVLKLVRGPMVGLGLALLSQSVFWTGDPDLAVPRGVAFYGGAMGLLLSSAVRLLFPTAAGQLQGANAPALWLKQAGASGGAAGGITMVLKGVAAIAAAAAAGTWMADHYAVPKLRVIATLLLMLFAYQIWKRG